jgi:hypothetical protein
MGQRDAVRFANLRLKLLEARIPATGVPMAVNHSFKATSTFMSVSGFQLLGKFVLNGSVNVEGSVTIATLDQPGLDKAFYTGDLTRPQLRIETNPLGLDGLSQRLRAAHSVEIPFTSSRDLGESLGLTALTSFSISTRRNFT